MVLVKNPELDREGETFTMGRRVGGEVSLRSSAGSLRRQNKLVREQEGEADPTRSLGVDRRKRPGVVSTDRTRK